MKQPINLLSISLFRAMLSLIFIVAGINHLTNTSMVLHKLENAPLAGFIPLYYPDLLIQVAGIALLLGGIFLLLGFKTRLAAISLLCLLLPITIIVQLGTVATLGPLFKNIAIAGGLIFFYSHGQLGYSIENYVNKEK